MTKRSAVTVRGILSALDDRYPFARAAAWDNAGLLVGDPGRPVRAVLIALDASPEVLAACRRLRPDLLLTHHPVIFRPLKSVRSDGPSAVVFELAQLGVSVISAHTNADAAPGGVSHILAERLGLVGIVPLSPGEPGDAVKVVVFVPENAADAVVTAASEAGGARIGAYGECSFRLTGEGTFRGRPESAPTKGSRGRLERVAEIRVEMTVAASRLSAVLAAIRRIHPYEEPAIDVVPLSPGSLGGGIGAVGDLPTPSTLAVTLALVERAIRPSWMLVSGKRKSPVRRVAVVGGSGAEYIGAACEAGADLFVTGDVKYHDAVDAAFGEMPVVDVGHGSSEKWILPEFRRVLRESFGKSLSIKVLNEPEPKTLYRAVLRNRRVNR